MDYAEAAFPGSEATFVFTADSFSLPVRAKNQAGARRLVGAIASTADQRAVHHARRSLPARTDVQLDGTDPVLRDKQQLLQWGAVALALSGLVPARFSADLNAALAEMLEQDCVEPVVHTLRSRYALLK